MILTSSPRHLIFTSQHVSINSTTRVVAQALMVNLHPNMYLLIQLEMITGQGTNTYLHPNMYLLIQALPPVAPHM